MNATNEKMKLSFILVVIALSAGALACGPIDLAREMLGNLPTATPVDRAEVHSSSIWYVAPDGDDGNGCAFPDDPCRTINGAIAKATEFDEIQLAPGTYDDSASSRAAPIVSVAKDLAIIGAGSDQTIIDGYNDVTAVFVNGGVNLRLEGVTIQNGGGRAPGSCLSIRSGAGATVRNSVFRRCSPSGIEHSSEGTLRLVNVIVTETQPVDETVGGIGILSGPGDLFIEGSEITDNNKTGLISSGPLEMTDTLVQGNGLEGVVIHDLASLTRVDISNNDVHPDLGFNHAGLAVGPTGDATIVESTISENDIGVDVGEGGRLTLQDSRVERHRQFGLFVDESGEATLDGTVIRANGTIYIDTSVPGGINNYGALTIRNSRIERNRNGGLGIMEDASLIMENSTVDGNRDDFPGIWNFGEATITSSTISRNENGGIDNRGTMEIFNSTVSENLESGISAVIGSLRLSHVTIADNGGNGLSSFEGADGVASLSNVLIGNNGIEDCEISSRVGVVPIPLAGTNLDSDGTCLFSDFLTPDLGIEPLGDNGGPTMTNALRADSPAIDAGTGTCPSTDQRGNARPVGGGCDVGAFESAFALTSIVPISGEAPPPTINRDVLCWKGPGGLYEVVSSVQAGTEVKLLGVGVNGGWFIIDSPRFPGASCWVEEGKIDIDPDLDLAGLKRFTIPPPPTVTPVPGCLYQGPNDNVPVCYPIDQCPVPFDQTDGACMP